MPDTNTTPEILEKYVYICIGYNTSLVFHGVVSVQAYRVEGPISGGKEEIAICFIMERRWWRIKEDCIEKKGGKK